MRYLMNSHPYSDVSRLLISFEILHSIFHRIIYECPNSVNIIVKCCLIMIEVHPVDEAMHELVSFLILVLLKLRVCFIHFSHGFADLETEVLVLFGCVEGKRSV